ncbi:MAG: FAD-linked oxidase C-terminal domain-containing protein [Candidatus Kapaibacterium sp.]|jgi:glycolate oxidase
MIDRAIFASILKPERILWREADRLTYDADGVTLEKFSPSLVLIPETKAELIAAARICLQHKLPIVTRGAGTGLSGGALAVAENTVLLVTTRLNKILEIDRENLSARVEPGVVNTHLSRAAKPYGLYFAPDPSSGAACTIGGNIAENAGGPHCLKYGATAEHILELEVLFPNGELRIVDGEHNAALFSLLIGSEGTLGIVTEARVRLLQIPEAVVTLLMEFETPRQASETVSAIIESGIVPAALEMIDREVLGALEAAFHLGFPLDAGALLIVELDGRKHSIERLTSQVIEHAERLGVKSIRRAKDEKERDALWKARKRAFGALGRLSPSYYTQDGVIPRHTLPDVLEKIAEIGKRYSLRIANIFHAGDGNLHPAILYDERDPAQVTAVLAASAEILKLCIAQGGSITGEHGVGIEKQEALGWMFAPVDIDMMRAVREVFNPNGLLNPGKFLPSDHSCREVGIKHRKVGV